MKTYLICFDVHNDRLRYRIAREIKKHGYRVQYSVFEAGFRKPSELGRLRKKLKTLCHRYEDKGNIRFYQMNKQTLRNSFTLDRRPMMDYPAVIIV